MWSHQHWLSLRSSEIKVSSYLLLQTGRELPLQLLHHPLHELHLCVPLQQVMVLLLDLGCQPVDFGVQRRLLVLRQYDGKLGIESKGGARPLCKQGSPWLQLPAALCSPH